MTAGELMKMVLQYGNARAGMCALVGDGSNEQIAAAVRDAARLRVEIDEAVKGLAYERDQYRAESGRLGDHAQHLVNLANEARGRANEAARLSAAARDEADDLRRQIDALRDHVAIVEGDRTDLTVERDALLAALKLANGTVDRRTAQLDEACAEVDRLTARLREAQDRPWQNV